MGESKGESGEMPRVLLCGADATLRGPLADHLRRAGYPVDVAAGGKDALDRVREVDYTVVLAGLRLEGMTGLELLGEAKGLRPELLFVAIAEREEWVDAIELIRRGAYDYFRTPVDPEDLVVTVRRAAEARRLREESGGHKGRVPAEAALRGMLKSQYRAALAMLREAVERCPDALWDDPRHRNRTWQIAYHALFFARYYGGRDERFDDFWSGHRRETQNPDGIGGQPDPKNPLPFLPDPYTKAEILAAWEHCSAGVEAAVDDLDLDAAQCGFPWYPIPKLEHQLVNIRHIQHHTGQISERLRREADIGIPWAGARRR